MGDVILVPKHELQRVTAWYQLYAGFCLATAEVNEAIFIGHCFV